MNFSRLKFWFWLNNRNRPKNYLYLKVLLVDFRHMCCCLIDIFLSKMYNFCSFPIHTNYWRIFVDMHTRYWASSNHQTPDLIPIINSNAFKNRVAWYPLSLIYRAGILQSEQFLLFIIFEFVDFGYLPSDMRLDCTRTHETFSTFK